ncbi:MAG: hypothetical protein CV045_11700 [Cyanobacteria bacterium M5B4]|nr:MAG: hypothetical protein CV045_11700 [Cyanobacteria bacterium M5B4]
MGLTIVVLWEDGSGCTGFSQEKQWEVYSTSSFVDQGLFQSAPILSNSGLTLSRNAPIPSPFLGEG